MTLIGGGNGVLHGEPHYTPKMATRVKSSGYYSNSRLRSRVDPPSACEATGYSARTCGIEIDSALPFERKFPLPKLDIRKGKLRWGGSWIPWDKSYIKALPMGPPFYEYDMLSRQDLPDDGIAELIRFLLTLEIWEQTPGVKDISARQVWFSSLTKGSLFADELKDMFEDSSKGESPSDSYNSLFPYKHLPRWDCDANDLELSSQKTYARDDALIHFSHVLDNLLREVKDVCEFDVFPSDEKILSERSTTTSYIHSVGVKAPHWQTSFCTEEFNSTELFGLRTKVKVYPGGVRDTSIADKSANNSIRWTERTMRHILEYVPESAVTLFPSTFERRLKSVVYEKGTHVWRDIKKCGLTFNTHDLFPIIKEKLMVYFPDQRWNRLDLFSNIKIVEPDGEVWSTERGYSLGFANHTVTLANIVIHRMCRDILSEKGSPLKMRAIFGNDDADVVFFGPKKTRPDLTAGDYLNLEHEVHGSLGNLTNITKSVIKPYGLFYEQYDKPGWVDKESLVCNALACAYLAPNVRVAKHYIVSQSDRFSSKWSRSQLRNLAEYWGGEFFSFKEELKVHYEVGGWLDTRSLGLKTTLRDIYVLADKHEQWLINLAVFTCKEFLTPPRPLFKRPGLVNNHLYKGPACESDPLIQIYTLSDEDLKDYYRRLTTFQRNYGKRLENYKSRVHPKIIKKSLDDILKMLLSRDPWYSIPEEQTIDPYFEDEQCDIPIQSELDKALVTPIEKALDNAQKGIKEKVESGSWNPKIPGSCLDIVVPTSRDKIISASQYSNTGALPLLEYFERYKEFPLCKPGTGRIKELFNDHRNMKFGTGRISSFEIKPKPKVNIQNPPECETIDPYDCDWLAKHREKMRERSESAIGLIPKDILDSFKAKEVGSQNRDFLLSVMDQVMETNREDHSSYQGLSSLITNQLFKVEESIDVFDNSDEEFGLDFF